MGEFFHGWRRKAGLVTLMMACLLTVGWMRSRLTSDSVIIPSRDGCVGLNSAIGGLRWGRWIGNSPFEITWSSAQVAIQENYPWGDMDVEWKREWAGFYFGAASLTNPPLHVEEWIIPYWSLVLPLTLISVWLILGKPRKAKGGG